MTEIELLERKIVLKRQIIVSWQEEQKQLERKIRNAKEDIIELRTQINRIQQTGLGSHQAVVRLGKIQVK